MTKQPAIEQRIDNLNHIADGRILATKADLLTIVNEAVVAELNRVWQNPTPEFYVHNRISELTTRKDKA